MDRIDQYMKDKYAVDRLCTYADGIVSYEVRVYTSRNMKVLVEVDGGKATVYSFLENVE